jgi:hypothetical protein
MSRTYEEDVDYWLGWVNGVEPEAPRDPLLPHLENEEILGLIDSYDDARIFVLALAYIELRGRMLGLMK